MDRERGLTQKGKTMDARRNATVIKNALVVTFGMDGYEAAYEKCLTSKRYAVLEAIAGHDEQYGRLIVAAEKIARNPKTRAQI